MPPSFVSPCPPSLARPPLTRPTAIEAEETSQDIVSKSAYFETFQGLDGHYYFSMTAANGQNVLRSQGYTKLASAQNGVASVLANGNDKRQFDVKQASNGDFYFNLRAANNEIIGTSELYASKSNAERGARTVRALVRVSRNASQAAPRRESFELFTGEDGKSYFHLRAGNGEIMLGSQGYTASASARGGIASVLANGSRCVELRGLRDRGRRLRDPSRRRRTARSSRAARATRRSRTRRAP